MEQQAAGRRSALLCGCWGGVGAGAGFKTVAITPFFFVPTRFFP